MNYSEKYSEYIEQLVECVGEMKMWEHDYRNINSDIRKETLNRTRSK